MTQTTIKPLPLLHIFLQALILSKRKFFDIVIVSSPFLLMVAVSIAGYIAFYDVAGDLGIGGAPPDATTENAAAPGNQIAAIYFLLLLFWLVALLATYVMASVGCYRVFLAGFLHDEKTAVLRWQWNREGVFLLWETLLGMFFSVGAVLVSAVLGGTSPSEFAAAEAANTEGFSVYRQIIFMLSMLPLALVLVRLFMIFPTVATDNRPDIKLSWVLTAGNTWRLALLLFVLPSLFELLVVPLLGPGEGAVGDVLVVVISLLVGFFKIGLLSLCYYYLKQHFEITKNK